MKKCAWSVVHVMEGMQRSSISGKENVDIFLFFILLQKVQNEQQLLEKGSREGKWKWKKSRNPNYTFQMVTQSVSQLLFGKLMGIPFGVTPASST